MKDRIVLITGGTSGIGKATAIAFAKQGANVIISSRTAEKAREVEQEIRSHNVDAMWIKADVSEPEEIKSMMKKIEQRYGHIDYAFNNAISEGKTNFIDQLDENEWDKTINGVLKSVFLCMKYELKMMLKKNYGAIVNNSSVDGLRGFAFNPAYSTAKHGVIGLTKSAAIQYSQKGIRINAVCPGWIKTKPMKEMGDLMKAHQPIGRYGNPEEIAEAVLWLCSDKSSFVLGTAFSVDGGYTTV